MKISGVIVEYNPMHSGHINHINKTKEITNCDGLVAITSGNFVQRGLPSIIDKWTKARLALENGVDLVLELPSVFSLSSAEFFSYGAISTLNNLNVIDSICFGSEAGDVKDLLDLSKILVDEPHDYKLYLKNYLSKGLSYVKSRNLALEDFNKMHNLGLTNISSVINSSNNILGIEYIKSLLKLKSNIKIHTIKREGSLYNDENINNTYSSASSIRKYLKENNKNINSLIHTVPKNSFSTLETLYEEGFDFSLEDKIIPLLQYKFLQDDKIINLPDVSEGIHNKILKSIYNHNKYEDIILNCKNKRFTYTRISRILCQYFLGFEKYDIDYLRKTPVDYIRVLGFNRTGAKILKEIKNNSDINIVTKLPKVLNQMLSLDVKSTNAYSLLNKNIKYNADYFTSPIIIK